MQPRACEEGLWPRLVRLAMWHGLVRRLWERSQVARRFGSLSGVQGRRLSGGHAMPHPGAPHHSTQGDDVKPTNIILLLMTPVDPV
ncbi:hypothetical protein Csa_021964 [Cucumis sativus]|uniref:Uncharacterized protein n=1 Tax=Cucumis sativus TaxID=3659 RepID=A0A0A0LMN1_CUCSA|nr:hypothetical protein Csa_021964 [Cucumis sativus]